MSFLSLLVAVAPVFLIIAAGYAIRRVDWLSDGADASLLRITVNLLFPCLILDTILGNKALEQAGNLLLAPAVGFGTTVLGYALTWFAAPLCGVRDDRARRTFAFTIGLANYGYIPIPLVQKLFDAPTTAVLLIHNVGVETAIWTAGLLLLTGRTRTPGDAPLSPAQNPLAAPARFSAEHPLRRVLNVPVLAICTAVTLHFLGGKMWLPSWVLNAIHSIGAAAIPMGLIMTGATFCDQARHLSLKGSARDSLGACLLRLALLPAALLLLARWLPCPSELRHVIIVQAAMPCAVVPVILAKHYGGDPAMALRIILITTAAGLLTIPLWMQFGLRWLG